MQLISDAITVLGSRHGLLFNPFAREVRLIRFDKIDEGPLVELRAGLSLDGREYVFPLCPTGELFPFVDQRMTPCSATFIGLHPTSGLKVTLKIVTPFRPRDADFSTVPVLGLELSVESIGGQYRWDPQPKSLERADLFLEIRHPRFSIEPVENDSLDLQFDVPTRPGVGWFEQFDHPPKLSQIRQHDRLVALSGKRMGTRFVQTIEPARSAPLHIAWCTWSEGVLDVCGQRTPFRYQRNYGDLDKVAAWARKHGHEILTNASRVDGIIAGADVGAATHHLLSQTLHSWLACTWWTDRGERDWFSVWEGNCYFHSTVDVEFTQAPFYLTVWPELLAIELDFWPEFSRAGEEKLGDAGRGTRFQCHDCGSYTGAGNQSYPHQMEVEETANYLLMLFAHARRTGDLTIVRRHAPTVAGYLRFLIACDTTSNGVPAVGVANTIDDGSPAIQYGRQQTYLAVKTLAALETGAVLAVENADTTLAIDCQIQARRLRATIEEKSWAQDHFVVLLERSGTLHDPWSGNQVHWDEVPGWDAPHIYTANTLPILDQVGFDLGLDEDRVRQDLIVATRRCLREYGCVHTDFNNEAKTEYSIRTNLTGASRNPGWIAMNIMRDLAALYRGIDLRHLTERYWDWQTLVNSRETRLFFETFSGNNLHFYPRGVVIWGVFDALGGVAIDRISGRREFNPQFPAVRVPLLFEANWTSGEVEMIVGP